MPEGIRSHSVHPLDPYIVGKESPRNGGINGYFTFEHGLLQGEPSIITSKWGFWHQKGSFITPDTHLLYVIYIQEHAARLNR
jgi:hypothetical protein